jgi:hypothetical protein
MPIDPAQFQRDPVGPDIAFLEDVDRHVQRPADPRGGHVMIAAIAEQHHVGDSPVAQDGFQRGGPVLQGAAIVDAAGQAPERPVAAVEIDLVNRVPGADQPLAQMAEQWTHQALQQQHPAPFPGAHYFIGHRQEFRNLIQTSLGCEHSSVDDASSGFHQSISST